MACITYTWGKSTFQMSPLLTNVLGRMQIKGATWGRCFHVSASVKKLQSGIYRPSLKKKQALTYEMANPPHYLAHRKSWNSWNTSNIKDGNRPSETAVEDLFIRRFMTGTWHNIFASEIIIKRQHNLIRIGGVIKQNLFPAKLYFLIGYTEELLSYWLQCPIKLELQSIADRDAIVFKYI